MKYNNERQEIEVARKRIPMKKLLHGREIRDGMAELEKFRQQFNEQEFFYKAKVYLQMYDGETYAVVKRPETDKEYDKRIAKQNADELARLERQRIKEEKARIAEIKRQERLAQQAEEKRKADIAYVKKMARELGLSAKELADLAG